MHLTKEQVANGEHEKFDPVRHDFKWNADYTEVEVTLVTWWDDASYAAYQSGAWQDEGDYQDPVTLGLA